MGLTNSFSHSLLYIHAHCLSFSHFILHIHTHSFSHTHIPSLFPSPRVFPAKKNIIHLQFTKSLHHSFSLPPLQTRTLTHSRTWLIRNDFVVFVVYCDFFLSFVSPLSKCKVWVNNILWRLIEKKAENVNWANDTNRVYLISEKIDSLYSS